MSDISQCICSKCGQVCKDKRGLAVHERKCGIEREHTCTYCSTEFSTPEILNRHLLTCKKYKQFKEEQQEQLIQQRIEQEREKLLQEFTLKLQVERIQYEAKLDGLASKLSQEQKHNDLNLNMIKEEQKSLFKEKEQALSLLDQEKRIQKELKLRIVELEKKNDTLNANMIDFAKRASDKTGTTIYNNGTLSQQVQNNNLQLQHFDGSLFRDKIIPPNDMIYSYSDLVDHVHKLGLGNFYRSADRSRNVVKWIDQDGKEIRDSNSSQLREKLLITMDSDIRKQLEYQHQDLSRLEAKHGDTYTDHMVDLSANIKFLQQLLSRNPELMIELQKELSRRAKNKTDKTIDVPRKIGYTQFVSKLETLLFPNVYQWMGLSFEQFGRWLATHLSKDIEIEEAMLYKERKFIKIDNDEHKSNAMYALPFAQMICKTYSDAISPKAREVYHNYLPYHPNNAPTSIHFEAMTKWLDSPTEPESEEVLRGILLHKMNRVK